MSFSWNFVGKKRFDEAVIKAVNKTAEDVLTNITMANVVPHKTGFLQRDSTDVLKAKNKDDSASIRWSATYAARLYYHPEYNFRKGRKGRWADDWINGSKQDFVFKSYTKNLRKMLGG